MTLSAGGGVLTSIIGAMQVWLQGRRDTHRVTIKIGDDSLELGGISTDERTALVRAFVQKRAG